jgi:large subunit ribosomal protein L9
VILLERIERLGQMGDVVKVRPGFARNFLLPQKKALRATADNRKYFDTQRTQLEAVNLKRREEAQAIAEPLSGMVVTLIRSASDMGHLYGSVTSRDLSDAVTANGVSIERNQIVLNRPIKALGLHPIRVTLHPEVSVEITANVARTADEAAIQLERGTAVLGEDQYTEDEAEAQDGPEHPFESAPEPEEASAEESPAAADEPEETPAS